MSAIATQLSAEGLPANLIAERSILGACLLEQRLIELEDLLQPGDFHLDAHRKIYAAMLSASRAGTKIDYITLGDELERTRDLESVGGYAYLTTLTDGLPPGLNVEHYAGIVKEQAMRRQVLWVANNAIQMVLHGEAADDVIATVERGFMALRQRSRMDAVSLAEQMMPTMDRIHAAAKAWREGGVSELGLSTSLRGVDEITGGMQPGEYWIVGGKTGTGKSSIAVAAALANAKAGMPVLICTPEMSAHNYAFRTICREGRINGWLMKNGRLSDDSMGALPHVAGRLAQLPIWIIDKTAPNIDDLVTRCRLMIRQHGIRLVVVDYLQLVESNERDRRMKIEDVSSQLRNLAKAENVTVLALSQLRRRDSEPFAEPSLDHLKESGQIENDAHVVLLIWRRRDGDVDQVLVAKQREGPQGSSNVVYDGKTMSYYDAEAEHA